MERWARISKQVSPNVYRPGWGVRTKQVVQRPPASLPLILPGALELKAGYESVVA